MREDRNPFFWNGTAHPLELLCKADCGLRKYQKWHQVEKKGKAETRLRLQPPEKGWLKCNFDGAWDEQRSMGGVGVIVRDDKGSFVAAMAKKIAGISSPSVAEIMAAREAALFLQELQQVKITMEEDALLVLSAVQNTRDDSNSPYGHLIMDAQRLTNELPAWNLKYTRRETNRIAHRLARQSLSSVK